MKDFSRVLRLSLRYRFTIITSIACSLMVGVLWGGNIAALYPFVEVVFRGESFHQWADNRVTDRQRSLNTISENIEKFNEQLRDAAGDERKDLSNQISLAKQKLASERKSLASAEKLKYYITNYLPDDPFQDMVIVVGALLAGTILKTLFLAAHVILVSRVRYNTAFDLRNQLFQRVVDMDMAAFGKQNTSVLMSRFTYDLKILEDGLGGLFGQAVREPLKMIACLAGAAFISWQLLLVSLIVAPIGLLGIHALTRAMKRATGLSMDVISELYGRLSETFNGIKAVKAFTMEEQECERFRVVGKEYVHRRMRFSTCFAFLKPVSETMAMGVVSMAILLGAYLVLNRETHIFGIRICNEPLSASALLVFFGMLAGIADPARKLTDIYAMLIGGIAAAGRIYALMDRVPKIADPAVPKLVPTSAQAHHAGSCQLSLSSGRTRSEGCQSRDTLWRNDRISGT
jgi:subfamily B ATP-binding cassette protein MsbA